MLIHQTAKYDACIVVASAVGLKKGSVQRKVRASETGIPPDLPRRTFDGYEGWLARKCRSNTLRRGPISLTDLHMPST